MIQVVKKETEMTPENFCYWLQGLLELSPDLKTLDEAQVKMVRDHLGYVFTHAASTPTVDLRTPAPGNFDLKKAMEAMGSVTVTNPAVGQKIVSIC